MLSEDIRRDNGFIRWEMGFDKNLSEDALPDMSP
jgi:hypothetical protein